MASRARGRSRKNNTAGNKRIDAALDAMRPFGFDEGLVRETVDELLDVYEGTQGWPFIEDASYKLLIETILGKQQVSSEEKANLPHLSKKKKNDSVQDNARKGVVNETSAATLTTATFEAGSSNLVAQDSLLRIDDGLNSAPQTNNAQDSASLGNQEFGGRDPMKPTQRKERRREATRLEPVIERKPVSGGATGSNNSNLGAKHVETTSVKPPVIQSSQARQNLPMRRRKPCYGWIGSDTDDEDDLIHLSLPPLPEEIRKLLERSAFPQSGTRRRRKSRWDEKPIDM